MQLLEGKTTVSLNPIDDARQLQNFSWGIGTVGLGSQPSYLRLKEELVMHVGREVVQGTIIYIQGIPGPSSYILTLQAVTKEPKGDGAVRYGGHASNRPP